jgi:hypothetical protein
MGHSVGKSSYGDLRGVEQFVSTPIVALQIASLCYEFDTQFPGARTRGDRLTVNEGIRSKARMRLLRSAWETFLRYGTPWAALAAALYFSTHREEIGTAVDFGITQKDGSNRAMTAAEAAWVHGHGVPRGILHTGGSFNPPESWHHNGGYAFTLPPITGVNLPGGPLFTDGTPAAGGSTSSESEPLMKIIHSPKGHTLLTEKGAYKFDPIKIGKAQILGSQQVKLMQRVIDAKDSDVLNHPTEFNDLEVDIIAAVLRKVK